MRPRRTDSARVAQPGFDFTGHIRRLCGDMVRRVDRLRHIDLDRLAVGFRQTRSRTTHGMFASLTGMRFAGGQPHTVRGGRKWGIQRLLGPGGREMLYLLEFYLPRFLDLPFREKLTTVVHELWHVSPRFDGDVRRHKGRCYIHGSSQKQYDALVGTLVDQWLRLDPPEALYHFLRDDFHTLSHRHGHIHGTKVRSPKLIPLAVR